MLIATTFCTDTASIWHFVGQLVTVFKIIIPIIIIILGIIDLGKAVIASDEKEISKATNFLIKRFIAGIVIFFIPTIVGALFSILASFSEVKADYNVCVKCITAPSKCPDGSTSGEIK